MVTVLRRSGIEVVGDVPWGTHFCQFYETGQDLIEVLVPYFHEGLKGNEFCMWITSEPLQVDQAKAALQAAVPDLDRYIEKGQIEILDYDQWYTRSGKFSADEVLRGWIDKLTAALERGYDGLRLTGNTFWLEKANWANFTKYEESVNNVIGRYRMLAICTYSLRKCGAMEILDVLANHQFALVKRSGKWEIVESAHHKKIEQALRRSEEMLRTAIDFTYDWEYWIDPEGKFVFISPSCERITGYSMNEFMTDPKLIEKIVHPDDSEHFSRHFLENDDKAISIDFRIIARNREERWISHICQSVYSSDGRYLGRRASNRDITDHKQTEYALKMTSVKSENERMRLKAVMESLPVGVAILNAQGGNIQSNRWFEEIWGRPRPEVRAVNDYTVFKAWWADTGKLVRPEEWASAKAVQNGETVVGQFVQIERFDGKRAFVLNSAAPIIDANGKIIGSAVAIMDITERIAMEKALRESEERLRLAQFSANVGIWDWNPQTGAVSFTPELDRLYGLAPGTIRTYQDWRERVHPDDILRIEDERDKAIDNHRSFNLDFRIKHGSGEFRWISAKGGAFYNEEGENIRVLGVNIDISKRKKVEEALSQERDFVSTVLDTAKALVVVLDTQGRIIRFNRECEQLTGYSFDEVQGKTFWDLFLLPEDIDIIKSKFNTFQSGDYPRKNENAWLTKDGMPKQIAWSNSVLKDKDDRVTNIIAIGIEITERKHMEEALRETRDYLENLVDHANAPIIVWDSSFRITRFNQAFERLTYLKADEVLGKQLDVLFPDGSKKDSMNLIRGTLTGERWETVEIPILRADKSVRIVLWNSANILGRDGTEVVATIAQGQDITDRKRMETELEQMVKELQETRDYLENLINYANAPIIVWDSSFMITRFNNAFEKLTGFKAAEVLGNHLDILFPSGSKRDSMNLIQSTLAGERWETVEIPILRTDGSERIVLWNSANILSQDGIEVIATIAQGQDITDRKRMETELEQMVLERTVELSAAKEELGMINEALRVEIAEHEKLELDLLKARDAAEKAARAKSAFMANMSHEIRTPMNSVIGMTSLLLDEDLNPEQKDFVETIRTGGEALLSIINDILDFSRLEREKTELEYQPFHLRNTIEEALDLVAARAAEKKLNLAYSVDKITPNMITGDPTRLRQILAILLDNAVKFTEKGEILVSVTSALSDFQYEVHFVVKDTGIGMEPAKMDHLFESFSQLDDSISTKYGGTGLGLAISKKLVALMGGKIWAESDIGKGSTFHFTILAKAISGKPKLARIEPKLKGKRILIVEDNRTNRRILGRQARDWGMMPTTTGSSREAIKLVQGEDSFDIAIIEKALPELDGLALAREIRRYSKTMPLVMLTFVGQGIESDLFAVTLTKPIKPAQLYNVLTDVLAPPFVTPQITAPEVSPEPGTMRILLAEDNLSSQKVTLQMLKKLGYRSDVVANGREVLEALGRQRYDLILMDVRMPEMNGLEATRIIRQRWPDKGPVIIAVTAYGLEGDREKCLAAGMDDYISKPVQLDDLAKMLRKYVAALTSKKASSKGRKTRH